MAGKGVQGVLVQDKGVRGRPGAGGGDGDSGGSRSWIWACSGVSVHRNGGPGAPGGPIRGSQCQEWGFRVVPVSGNWSSRGFFSLKWRFRGSWCQTREFRKVLVLRNGGSVSPSGGEGMQGGPIYRSGGSGGAGFG